MRPRLVPGSWKCASYFNLLVDVILAELLDIRREKYEPDGQRSAKIHVSTQNMVADLEREENYALDWWRSVENSSVVDLCKKRLSLAPLFIDAARAFLLTQASSASAERLLGRRWVPGRYSPASNGFFCGRDVAHGEQLRFTQINSPLNKLDLLAAALMP